MAYDLDEQEQLDQLKAWWNKYGTLVVTLLVIATIVAGSWRGCLRGSCERRCRQV